MHAAGSLGHSETIVRQGKADLRCSASHFHTITAFQHSRAEASNGFIRAKRNLASSGEVAVF